MTGFTSVPFRQLAVDDMIRLAVQAGLDGIEWGGDIHVPPGELQHAIDVGIATRANGLQVFSYGSYYRLGAAEDAAGAFLPILQTAAALCTGQIRIWAGSLPPDQADEEVYRRAAQELCTICELAGKEGISIGLEYHRNTLTQTVQSTLRLLRETDCANLFTYWQPNPDITQAEREEELRQLRPYLSNLHVFHWIPGDIRRPLSEGQAEWLAYARLAGIDRPYILEFVPDDDPQALSIEADTLRKILKAASSKEE